MEDDHANKPAIDRRLDRLTERHEALTQSIELMHRDWEERWTATADALKQDGENIRTLARNSKILHESIQSLEAIATAHQQRIEHLEGQ